MYNYSATILTDFSQARQRAHRRIDSSPCFRVERMRSRTLPQAGHLGRVTKIVGTASRCGLAFVPFTLCLPRSSTTTTDAVRVQVARRGRTWSASTAAIQVGRALRS